MKPGECPVSATYRVQLHRGFTLREARALLEYLGRLGVSHLYLSPVLTARRGSTHGYDGVDPRSVGREIGGEAGLRSLAIALQRRQAQGRFPLGALLDIVPNHQAADLENCYWSDALARGPDSPYWKSYDLYGDRIVLPILENTLEESIADGTLRIELPGKGGLCVAVGGRRFPLSPGSQARILAAFSAESGLRSHEPPADLRALRSRGLLKGLRRFLERAPAELIQEVLGEQAYALAGRSHGRFGYRRFFDIDGLVGVRVEDEATLAWTHEKLFELLRSYPALAGVRVDHIDGLVDPKSYLLRLQRHCEHVWVEKILSEDEVIPLDWPVHGSTGYDFLNAVSKVFVDDAGHLRIQEYFIEQVEPRWKHFSDCVYEAKKDMMRQLFGCELASLAEAVFRYLREWGAEDLSREDVRNTLEELTACLKVYRTYFQGSGHVGPGQDERRYLQEAVEEARRRGGLRSPACLELVARLFMDSQEASEQRKSLLARWQQFSGPVMAKGLEDTALYRYFPLLSLNAIGGGTERTYNTVTELHSFNEARLKSHPLALSTTTTHDTKRHEDVRARLHVLSELSERWLRAFEAWSRENASRKEMHAGKGVPGPAAEYFLYQTLLGAWPVDGEPGEEFVARIKEHMLKAAREAKLETSWMRPDESYEQKLLGFVDRILDRRLNRLFLKQLRAFSSDTAYFGAFNSLSELAFKVFSPGIPDVYQGTETWSYYLVDPDNRRPVNYPRLLRMARRSLLRGRQNPLAHSHQLASRWKTGEIKQWLLCSMLCLRRQDNSLFTQGQYLPLEIFGPRRDNALGFVRFFEGRWVLVLAPRLLAGSMRKRKLLGIPAAYWRDTWVQLPPEAPTAWRCQLTGRQVQAASSALKARDAFGGTPVALLVGNKLVP